MVLSPLTVEASLFYYHGQYIAKGKSYQGTVYLITTSVVEHHISETSNHSAEK